MKGLSVIEYLRTVGQALWGLNEQPKARKSVLRFARGELNTALTLVERELEETENDSNDSRSDET